MDIEDELAAHVAAITTTVRQSSATVTDVAARLSRCFRNGGKLLICGNGGSAADAQHVAAEFMNRLRFDRPPLPAVALTTDTSVLSSVANDSCYDEVFARQVHALGCPGDVLLALSTSGSSVNVLVALAAGRRRGMITIGFTGASGQRTLAPLSDVVLAIPSDDCARIQECHEFLCHIVAGIVEEELFGVDEPSIFSERCGL